jgi:hypothetical protein
VSLKIGRVGFISPHLHLLPQLEKGQKKSNLSNYLSFLGKIRAKGTKGRGSLHSICSVNKHPTPRAIYQSY